MTAKVRIYVPLAYHVANQSSQQFLQKVMVEMTAAAKVMASEGEYATGHLAASIQKQGPTIVGTQVIGAIGSRLDYAQAVHNGARRHDIFPKGSPHTYRFTYRGRPQLKFYWKRAGKVVFFPHIPGSPSTVGRSHPGIRRPNRYLAVPLTIVGARHGMRVTINDV